MKTLEQILETLKTITPETAEKTIETVAGELRNLIFEERTHAHNMAREQMHKTIKTQLASLVPDEFQNLDKTRWEDMIPVIAAKLKTEGEKPAKKQQEQTETLEQIRARLESEYAKKLEEERRALAVQSALSQIEAAAIAKRLDPAYKSIFSAALANEVDVELTQDNKTAFKSKADGKYFVRDGQHATPEYVAEEILKRYPRLVAQQVQAPQPPANTNGIPIDKLKAGLSELKIFSQ
jgi:hypothetical protein